MTTDSAQPKQNDSSDDARSTARPRLRRAVETVRRWGPTAYTVARIVWRLIQEAS
ncbi:hypothetical protein [Streptomyces sp. KL118A]|uniref:hypothetical protein n=1 Tax=Streptomyces sp. KL118A TaxID=3045153 RepID=UPI00278BC980|nr:hypothetical protein [Streptomyces sp. KL118A]